MQSLPPDMGKAPTEKTLRRDADTVFAERRYRSPLVAARLLRILALISAAAAAASAAYLNGAAQVFDRLRTDPLSVVQDDFVTIALNADRIAIFMVIAQLVTTILLLIWLHRAYRNLMPMGAKGTRFGSGWAIGSWFVPILNLFRPKQMIDEVWRASDPELPETFYTPDSPVPKVVHFFWGFWVAAWMANLALRVSSEPATLGEISGMIRISFFGSVATAVAMALLERTIAVITKRHQQRAVAVGMADAPLSWVVSPRREGKLVPSQFAVVAFPVVVAVAAYAISVVAVDATESGGTGLTSSGQSVTTDELDVGDCFDFPSGSYVVAVPLLPCDEPHDGELIGTVDMGSASDPFPGDDEIVEQSFDACLPLFESWVGSAYETSELDIAILYPTDLNWAAGKRTTQCIVVRFDGGKLTAPSRDSGL